MDYSACEEESDDEQRGSPHVDIDLLAPTSKLYRGDVTGKSHGGSSKSSYSSSSKYEGGQKEKGSAEAPASGTQPKMPAGPQRRRKRKQAQLFGEQQLHCEHLRS